MNEAGGMAQWLRARIAPNRGATFSTPTLGTSQLPETPAPEDLIPGLLGYLNITTA